jgi:hypothetical protein
LHAGRNPAAPTVSPWERNVICSHVLLVAAYVIPRTEK